MNNHGTIADHSDQKENHNQDADPTRTMSSTDLSYTKMYQNRAESQPQRSKTAHSSAKKETLTPSLPAAIPHHPHSVERERDLQERT
jgi:hypothetical protein